MNPEQFLTKVERLLETARYAESGLYTLYLENDEPRIERGHDTRSADTILALLTSVDISHGLVQSKWTQIRDRYAIFTKRIQKCHHAPQH